MNQLTNGLFLVGAGAAVLAAFWAGAFSAVAAELVAVVRGPAGAGAQPDVSAGPGPGPSAERSA